MGTQRPSACAHRQADDRAQCAGLGRPPVRPCSGWCASRQARSEAVRGRPPHILCYGRRRCIRAGADLGPSVALGEMRERSNRTVSKTVEPVRVPWVRIPLSPRAVFRAWGPPGARVLWAPMALVGRWYIRVRVGALRAQLVLRQYAADLRPSVVSRRDDRVVEGARLEGVCTRKGTVGSNPTLSVTPSALISRSYAMGCRGTPSGPEGSSGTRRVHEP